MNDPRRPRVLLADDHLMVAEALKSLLAPEFDLVGVVEDGRALVEAAGRLRPDVIVADITMPHLNGIDALVHLRQHGDPVPVVFLTMHRDASFARSSSVAEVQLRSMSECCSCPARVAWSTSTSS